MTARAAVPETGRRAGTVRLVAVVAAAALALAFPQVFTNNFVIHVAIVALIFAILAASWDLLYGYVGLINFGHAAFFGVGAYTSALLSYYVGLSPWLGLLAGGLTAAAFGAVVGIPSLRLRSVYLAITTLSFSEIARIIVTNWQDVTRGTLGFGDHPPLPGVPFEPVYYYYIALALAVAAIGFMHWLANHSRTGLILRAIRDDDIRARAIGIDILRYKIGAFVLSGFFAGVAGAFYAHYVRLVGPNELAPWLTIIVVAMAAIGGVGTIIGPAIAALVIHGLTEYLHVLGTVYNQIAVGAVLVLFVMFLPKGIAGLLRKLF